MEALSSFFYATAWPMTPPEPYSSFHIILTAAGIITALLLATFLSRKKGIEKTVLFVCGIILLIMEAYKQGFLYFVQNGQSYDWWYFPFQLCSIPMYLCLAVPILGSEKRSGAFTAVTTFLQDFGLLGGFMALLVPPGLMHPYWTLTLHGFFWHFILLFIGFYCAIAGLPDNSAKGFAKTLPILFTCVVIALIINYLAGPTAEMFYISPYHPSDQPVFRDISRTLGIWPGIFVYVCSMAAGGAVIHLIAGCLTSGFGHRSG